MSDTTRPMPKRRQLSADEYVAGVRAGDRAVLGRAISLVESNARKHRQLAQEVLVQLLPETGKARRVGISTQAVGQLVDDLEEMGLVIRSPDPDDRRAKRVCFSEQGRQGLLQGLAVLKEVEAELEDAIGSAKMQQLHRALTSTLGTLDSDLDSACVAGPLSR